MSQERDTTIALFLDFDNVALGARDARQRFDVKLLMQRLLEKGKILVKKAYADWHYYKEHMQPLHESAIELIEIPMPRISGKNSADIKLVVDAMELCYTNDHIDTFVIVSGDSDFSPLVSKLRENNKRVIGVGVKNSSSHLLINNCDEFIFYDNIYRDAMGQSTKTVGNVPSDKREMFEFLVGTVQSLLQESRGSLYSSLIKDTMTRKMPDFNERSFGYSTFGDMLDDARRLGLLVVERDARAGGTWVVQGLGNGKPLEEEGAGGRSSSRRRRRSSGRKRSGEEDGAEADSKAGETDTTADDQKVENQKSGAQKSEDRLDDEKRRSSSSRTRRRSARVKDDEKATEQDKAQASAGTGPEKGRSASEGQESGSKKTAKKKTTTTTKKTITKKKTPARKTPTRKATTKKTTTKKAPAKKSSKKATTKKKATGKAATKKSATRKTTPRKKTGKRGSGTGD